MKIIRWKQLYELTGLSRTTVWRYEKKGDFPRRRRLGAMTVGWVEQEVQEWIKSRPQQTTAKYKED